MTEGIIQKVFKKMIEGHSPNEHQACFLALQQELIAEIKKNRLEFSVNNVILLIGDNQ